MIVVDEGTAVVGVVVVWLVGPLAAPGIPRSLRSRPFRPTKGAYASELLGFGGCWLFGW